MLGPGRSGAAKTHALLVRPPRPGPTRTGGPCAPRDRVFPGPAGRIYRCARPALVLRSALCNNTVSRVGNETWEENKAAGGVRSGGRRPCRRRERRRKAERGAWQGGGSPGRSYSWGARKPGAGGEHVTSVLSGRESRVSTEPSEPQSRLVLPEELRGDHLEPLHRDLVTESSVIRGPGHTGPC